MLWIIQKNLWSEPEYLDFVDILNRSEIPHQSVKVIPFSHDDPSYGMIPKVVYPGRKIAYGSTTMMRYAIKEKWDPGCYYNEDFNYKSWYKAYGNNLLNHDAVVCKFKDVKTNLDEFFIRPCKDLKEFTGELIAKERFEEWKDRVLNMDSESTLCGDTEVSYAPPKKIYKEYRFFIVDYNVCTYSLYRLNGALVQNLPVEPEAVKFAQKMADKWSPEKVFALDVALTPDGYKVIEINCANGAGFYSCDISKLVQTIWSMENN